MQNIAGIPYRIGVVRGVFVSVKPARSTAAQCADLLLDLGHTHKVLDITPMKLQKLLYFAQGLELARANSPLFDEDFQAWRYGPVIPSIYRRFKAFGADVVPITHPYRTDTSSVPSDVKDRLVDVIDTFGKLTPSKLSDASHAKGGPWDEVFEETAVGVVISQASMRRYFAKLLNLSESNGSRE